MIKLDRPIYSFEDSLDKCEAGVTSDPDLLAELQASRASLLSSGLDYHQLACQERLYTIPAINARRGSDPRVEGNLTKSDFSNLYSAYFRDSNKPARKIYDYILTSSNRECPFCCGANRANQVDHFLPKAHYPQYSVNPDNLVPSCQYCNEDYKKQFYAQTQAEQIIQPYFDNPKFFKEQWIFAKYIPACKGLNHHLVYFVKVPDSWGDKDEYRANKHFEIFELGTTFREQSDRLISTVMAQVQSHLESATEDFESIIKKVIEPGIIHAPYINHWQRAMYMAVKEYLEDNN